LPSGTLALVAEADVAATDIKVLFSLPRTFPATAFFIIFGRRFTNRLQKVFFWEQVSRLIYAGM